MADTTVKLEPELYKHAERLVASTGAFNGVDDYVNCVLSALFGYSGPAEADDAEEQRLRERLEQLGYM